MTTTSKNESTTDDQESQNKTTSEEQIEHTIEEVAGDADFIQIATILEMIRSEEEN